MKYTATFLLITCACAAMAVSAYELTSSVSATTPERSPAARDSAREERMKQQAIRILDRVGMSAPLDATETTDPVTGIDSVQELYNSGSIIPATLEEVEAALQAAAQTPELEDDKAAKILKHRGSYRYFLKD